MWPFKFPYTNFHELNLDWILETIKELKDKVSATDDYIAQEIAKQLTNIPQVLQNAVFLTPEVFGAIGDGITDDTGSMKTFIATLAASGRPGYLLAANYRISETLMIPSNVAIYGSGDLSKVTQINDTYAMRIENANNVKLAGFNIYCPNDETHTASYAIYIKDATFVNIEQVNTHSAVGGIVSYPGRADTSHHIDIKSCEVTGYHNILNERCVGILIADTSYVNISDCDIRNVEHFGIEFKNSCYNCICQNCRAFDSSYVFYTSVNTAKAGIVAGVRSIVFDSCVAFRCAASFIIGNAYNVMYSNCCTVDPSDNTGFTVINSVEGLLVTGHKVIGNIAQCLDINIPLNGFVAGVTEFIAANTSGSITVRRDCDCGNLRFFARGPVSRPAAYPARVWLPMFVMTDEIAMIDTKTTHIYYNSDVSLHPAMEIVCEGAKESITFKNPEDGTSIKKYEITPTKWGE